MNFKELLEGTEPKLPGAPKGVKIMTPQQFVAKGKKDEEDVAEGVLDNIKSLFGRRQAEQPIAKATSPASRPVNPAVAKATSPASQPVNPTVAKDVNTATTDKSIESALWLVFQDLYRNGWAIDRNRTLYPALSSLVRKHYGSVDPYKFDEIAKSAAGKQLYARINDAWGPVYSQFERSNLKEGMTEATKLSAPTRELKGQELTDYLDRIRKQEKEKADKYKLPYIHRSSVIGYYDESGKKYNIDSIKNALKERPKKLLKQNEKMKHSNGELEQFFNIGFAALVGIALDEQTNELIVVNTCPGAGSCKVDCFAMKGGKIQFQGPWLSDGRILTFLLNDPEGFFRQLNSEIKKEEKKGDKGGYSVTIRWHDAGDFFSPEYVNLAFKLARDNPDVMFYAYTKIADVVLAEKPANFMINWSEGAHTSQEKKVKEKDPSLEKTKNSRIVPSDLFYDLLVKDEKKNLVKGPEGQWQVIPDKLPELKQRLAKEYNISPNSILSYNEWENKTNAGKARTPIQYNVIIAPGEPDLTARDAGVLSTLLLKH